MMKSTLMTRALAVFLLASALGACQGGIFDSIEIADGTKDASASQTVNGSIRVGDDVTVTSGTFRSVNGSATVGSRSAVPGITVVNGSIRIGAESHADDLETINGSIQLGDNTQVAREVKTVNGGISLAPGSRVAGRVIAVNGRITLDGATVVGNVENVNGDITLAGPSIIEGDLVVRRPQGISLNNNDRKSVVTIGAEARVAGQLIFEREVELRLHRGAQVGEISGTTPIWIEPEAEADTGV